MATHGRAGTYNSGCRCDECRQAYANWRRWKRNWLSGTLRQATLYRDGIEIDVEVGVKSNAITRQIIITDKGREWLAANPRED